MDEHRESFQARSSRSHPWKAGASSAAKQTTACRPRQSSRQDGVGRLLAPRERQRRACPRIVLLGTCPRWCTNQPHPDIGPLLAALYEHGVELLLTGRSHNYERLEPITPEGIPDPRDVTQFLIGTGGRNHRANTRPQLSISEVLRTDVFGGLELGAYRARFVGQDGLTVDQSNGTCHPPPPSA
jgi:hypothetical protein